MCVLFSPESLQAVAVKGLIVGGGGVRSSRFSFSTSNHDRGTAARRKLLVNFFFKDLSSGMYFTADTNDDHLPTCGIGPATNALLHIVNFSSIQLSVKVYL